MYSNNNNTIASSGKQKNTKNKTKKNKIEEWMGKKYVGGGKWRLMDAA